MKRNTLKATFILGMLCSLPPAAAEEALVSFKMLTPEAALELAQATLKACREKGYQVAVGAVGVSGAPAANRTTPARRPASPPSRKS